MLVQRADPSRAAVLVDKTPQPPAELSGLSLGPVGSLAKLLMGTNEITAGPLGAARGSSLEPARRGSSRKLTRSTSAAG